MAKADKESRVPAAVLAKHERVQRELSALLGPVLSGVEVSVAHSARWRRMQVTVTWPGFAELLAEERFRIVVEAIPHEFFEEHLKAAVWFELAAGETEHDLLKMPRSEDVAEAEPRIMAQLMDLKFFDRLQQQMGPDATKTCAGHLQISKALLRTLGVGRVDAERACLAFIRHHAFCDCQVLLRAKPELEALVTPTPKAKKKTKSPPAKAPRSRRG
jgi:hypothetical protein